MKSEFIPPIGKILEIKPKDKAEKKELKKEDLDK